MASRQNDRRTSASANIGASAPKQEVAAAARRLIFEFQPAAHAPAPVRCGPARQGLPWLARSKLRVFPPPPCCPPPRIRAACHSRTRTPATLRPRSLSDRDGCAAARPRGDTQMRASSLPPPGIGHSPVHSPRESSRCCAPASWRPQPGARAVPGRSVTACASARRAGARRNPAIDDVRRRNSSRAYSFTKIRMRYMHQTTRYTASTLTTANAREA